VLAASAVTAFAGTASDALVAAVADSEGLQQITTILENRASTNTFAKVLKDLGVGDKDIAEARKNPEFARQVLQEHLASEQTDPALKAAAAKVLTTQLGFSDVVASIKAAPATGNTTASAPTKKFSLVQAKTPVTTAQTSYGPNDTSTGRVDSIIAKIQSLPGLINDRVTAFVAALRASGSKLEAEVGPGVFEKCGGFDPAANNTLVDLFVADANAQLKGASVTEAIDEVLETEGSAENHEEAEEARCQLATQCHLTAGAAAEGCSTVVAAQ
jgi:hypothetical protein